MSCHPRLTDDPYTFTFTEPPASTTFFKNSQIQKLPPIKQQNKVQNQVKSQGVNGIGLISNGLHTKNHVPIYARSQQQAQHIVLYRKSQANQTQQVTKKSSPASIQPPPPPPPPPQYQQMQRTFIVNQHNHSVTSSPVQQQQQSTKKQQISRTSFVSSFDNFITTQKKTSILNKVKYEKNEPSENVLKLVNGKSINIVKSSNGTATSGSKNTSAQVFVRPKVEAKAFVTVKKSTGKSQSVTRVKRSYSQSSHHEALQRISAPKSSNEWHAPDAYVFDYAGPGSLPLSQVELMPFTQNIWHQSSVNTTSREQRLEEKKNYLRRQAYQLEQAQKFRHTRDSKKRLVEVAKTLLKPKSYKEPTSTKKCVVPSCTSDSLALTAYCFLHITLNTDQRLFHPCTAKFADNSQCRVPVFDISHELPLCREHAWKRDNYNRMLQEQKPKKPPRKKPKPSAMTRPPKRNKKKKRPPQKQNVISAIDLYNHATVIKTNGVVVSKAGRNDISRNNGSVSAPNSQEFFTICENSSAYESSEDTGVGGLSESELIGTSDEIPLGDARLLEEHELTNVLNQLPEELAEEAFNELFTVQHNDPYEPTQEEQEDLERALEEVGEQVKSLEEMTGPTNFLDDFLDDEIAIIDDADICTEVLHSPDHQTDNRGMIHT
ncbi:INO80 complex subunit D [Pseudolycoriella hygida]|uniref:INO80 complex subunit D n=1 Tax=Pseudolycoriella hygida TaxID=35572 RepID=A0A9Q0MXZ1_9DIPT|nr:INO80 complex subunit D [Pseudolycoriella hygida]